MKPTQQIVDTRLGKLVIRAEGLEGVEHRIDLLEPQVELPPGMSVDGIAAAILSVDAESSTQGFRFRCAWDRSPASGDPESGECLDAQSWDRDGHRVSIGTEDFDALCHRLPQIGFTESCYPVSYADDGLTIRVPAIPDLASISLHFIIAWRSLPDPKDCSTWFAVDIPHAKLATANKAWVDNRLPRRESEIES